MHHKYTTLSCLESSSTPCIKYHGHSLFIVTIFVLRYVHSISVCIHHVSANNEIADEGFVSLLITQQHRFRQLRTYILWLYI